jgi:ATP-dependent helicase/nuclease subunit B
MSPAPNLIAHVDERALTLLPTAESARSLRRAFDDAQRARGLHAWQPANILSWQQFLDRLWSDAIVNGIDPRLLLNATQEHALWLDTVANTTDTLASPDALATLCAEAWTLANAYHAAPRLRATATTHDSRTFATWAEAFTRDCTRNQFLTRATLEAALSQHITTQALAAPPTLTLIAFPNLTPAQQSLLEALRTAGTDIAEHPFLSFPLVEAGIEATNKDVPHTSAAGKNAAQKNAPSKNAVISTEAKRSGETPEFSTASPTTTAQATTSPLEGARLQPCHNPQPQQRASAPEVSLSPSSAHLYPAPTEPDELRAIAHYLRTFLESTETTPHIAVLLPDPTEAPSLETTFREILAPELQSITADTDTAPWQFPNAGPLATQPILATALDLAHFAQSPLDLNQASALILSPYLGAEETDRNTAARFDAESLRRRATLRPEIDLTALHRLAQSSTYAPPWITPLHHFLTNTNLDTPRTHAAWAEFTRSLLATANWPGPRTLTSLEYQATEAWDALLDQLSTLDFRGRRIPYADFLSILTRQASTTQFTPASTNAPIQILTSNAAIAQHFDVLIFARATDANYPPTERTHPLLGFALQSQLDMPGAIPLRAAARARQTFAQLLTAAPNILITYATETPEGEQHLSPLLASLAHLESVNIAPADNTEITATISVPDDAPLPPLPSQQVAGGATLLKLQAACPFLAFAQIRLRSNELDTQSTGFDALESGNFLHRALRIFWTSVKTQQALRDLPIETRNQRIATAVDQAVSQKIQVETPWETSYLDIQKERLRRVLQQWCEHELQRGPFEVLDLEREEEITVGPMTLRVIIDRIDAVSDGHVFVDYKTGQSANPRQWEDDRPEEPQLPLYSLLSNPGELKALTFARVRTGDDMGWQGYQSETGILPQKRPETKDLDFQIEQWRTTLTTLAEDFAAGVAHVNPKEFSINCKHCAQRLLCRINPESFLTQQDEAEDTGEESE